MDSLKAYHPLGACMDFVLNRYWQGLGRCLQVALTYLGIAALVVIVLMTAVPDLRDQGVLAHRLLTLDLQSQDVSQRWPLPLESPADGGQARVSPLLAAEELTWAEGDAATDGRQPGARIALPELNFSRALVESQQDEALPGATPSQVKALRNYIARKYRIAGNVAGALIQTAFIVGGERDLDPQLLLAVIAIESRYNPYAESHVGAQGLMQVMTRVHEDKFAAFGEGPMAAVHPLANMRVGAQILADCIQRRGGLDGGLACYVGATGPSDGGYGAKVKAEWRRLALASGIAIARDAGDKDAGDKGKQDK